MARPPIPTIQQVGLRPVASPVDTFVQPARSGLRDLAESLATIDRPLQEFIGRRAEKQAKEDAIRGEAAFYSDNAEGLAEGVRTGKIPPQYSPGFVQGWKNAQGNVAGGQLRQKFAQAFDAWEGKNSDDPAAYDQFLQDFLKENIGESTDPEVLRGLLPSVQEIQQNGRSRYIEYRAKQTYDGFLQTGVAAANQTIDEANDAGLASEAGTDYPSVFSAIAARREEFVSKGGNPDDFDKSMIDAMSLKVLEKRDPGLLAWFDQKVPGKDYTYGDSPYGSKVKQATLENLEVVARRQESDDAERQKREDKLKEDETIRQTLDLLAQNPGAPIPDGLMQQGSRYIPDYRSKLASWREDLNKGFTDTDDLKHVYTEVLEGGGTKAVMKAMEAGVFGRVEDLNAAMTFARSFEDNKDKIEDALGSNSAKEFLSAIDQRTKGMSDMGEPIPGMSNEGFEATYDFKRMVQDWTLRNPEASLQEREDAINKIGKTVLDRMGGGDGVMEPQTYQRPADQEFDNPFTDGTGVAPQQEDAEPEEDGAVRPEDTNKFLEQMPADQRKDFDKKAKDLGLTPEQLGNQLLNTNPSLVPISYDPNDTDLGEGDEREAGISVEQATAFIDEAFSEGGAPTVDGQDGALLELVSRHESGGNYNAVYGNAKSKRDLSQFTVDDILARQQHARRNGAKSTAIGKFQIIMKTLKSLKAEMGLTGTEKFTPELQDQMGLTLLRRRGLDKFRAGNMSKRAFALALSQEWASLPNPNTGRSYYAGDGLNKSFVRPSEVYRALGFAI